MTPQGSVALLSHARLIALLSMIGEKSSQNPPVAGALSEIAFHEKAGWNQVNSFVFLLDKIFSPAE